MASAAGAPFLANFWVLSSAKSEGRVAAGSQIVDHLRGVSAAAAPSSLPSDLVYARRRLVRGITSSHQGARLGFAATLSATLSEFASLNVKETLEQVSEASQVRASALQL